MADRFAFDVFLSYHSKDKRRARALAERLRAARLRVWFDEWEVKPDEDMYFAIQRGLEAARVQVLCLSPAALGSEWVTLERNTVRFRDPSSTGRRFIPLLLTDCDLPDTLRRYKYFDYRRTTKAALDELLVACRSESESAKPVPTLKPARRPPQSPGQAEPLAVHDCTLRGHEDWVWSVAVSPDGAWAASGSRDETIMIWDLETGRCREILEDHDHYVNSIAITPDGKRILSGSHDRSVRVWDSASGRELLMLAGHTKFVWSVVALRNNSHALSASGDGTFKLWNLNSGKCVATIDYGADSEEDGRGCAVNSLGTKVLSGHYDGRLRLWSLKAGKCLATLKGHSDSVTSVQITPDERFAISGSDDRTVKVWDLKKNTCVGTLEGHRFSVHAVAISFDGNLIASAGSETVRLWDLQSGVCLQVIKHPGRTSPTSVAFSLDGSRLVVGTEEPSLVVYRLSGGRTTPLAEVARRYVNAKVVLIGEGSVGKTSLAHRLIEDCYVVRDRTHGMNVWPLDLPLPPDATFEREALLWDLAGQEDYRLIHRLFLEQTALALLLINPQKDDPFADAGDWLKALQTAATASSRPVPRLLIFSQADVGGMKIGNAKIERFREQNGFAGWLTSSAKTGENCSDIKNGGKPSKLKQMIADHIPWSTLPWTATPRLLAELKNAVMTMRDKSDIRLLRFSELTQRLAARGESG